MISWPSDYQFTKEKAAGVDTLSVPVTEPDSLLCADVKNLFSVEQRKCSASAADAPLSDTHCARPGHCWRTWGVLTTGVFEAFISVKQIQNYNWYNLSTPEPRINQYQPSRAFSISKECVYIFPSLSPHTFTAWCYLQHMSFLCIRGHQPLVRPLGEGCYMQRPPMGLPKEKDLNLNKHIWDIKHSRWSMSVGL